MKTFQRRRTLDEFKAECQRLGWPLDDSKLEDGSSDFVSFKFKVGRVTGAALFSTVNGRVFGTREPGGRFSTDDQRLDGAPWFDAILEAAFTNEPAKQAKK